MAGGPQVRIGVDVNSGPAEAGVKSVKRSLLGLGTDAKKSVLAGVGLGAGVSAFNVLSRAVAGTVGFLGDAVDAARADETSIALLTQSLKENTAEQGANIGQIEQTIAKRMALGFADEEQRESLRALVAVTKDSSKALDLQRTAMDLARLKGMDLETATTLLGKVYGGNLGILARYGIQLEKGATATEAIAEIQRRAAGQAETWANTSAGAAETAAIAFDELKEDIGRELLPVMTELAKFARDQIVPALKAVIPVIKELVPLIAVGLGVKALFALKALATQARLTGLALKSTLPIAITAGLIVFEQLVEASKDSLHNLAKESGLTEEALLHMGERGTRGYTGVSAAAKKAREDVAASTAMTVGWAEAWQTAAEDIRTKAGGELALFADDAETSLRDTKHRSVAAARLIPGEVAQALRDGRESWKAALATLSEDIESETTRAARIAELKAALVDPALVRGLKSGDPLVRAQAEETLRLITAELNKEEAAKAGFNVGSAWAAGLISGAQYQESNLIREMGIYKSYLYGFSPPKAGPLKNIDKGGFNIGKAWAQSFAKGIGTAGNLGLDVAAPSASASFGLSTAGAASGSPVVIQLQVDGRTLAEIVDRQLYYARPTQGVLGRG